jgi:hypothetical protein
MRPSAFCDDDSAFDCGGEVYGIDAAKELGGEPQVRQDLASTT